MVLKDRSNWRIAIGAGIAALLLAYGAGRPVNASDDASALLLDHSLQGAVASTPGEHRLLLSESGSAATPPSPAGELGVDPNLEAALVLVPPPAWAGLLVLAAMAVGRTRQRRRYRR